MSEGRAHPRYRVWLPIRVSSDTLEGAIAVSRDASVGGLMMSSAQPLDVGAHVELVFALPPVSDDAASPGAPTEHRVGAVIVRLEPNTDDPHGPWPFRAAVRFDTPLADLEVALSGIAAELAKPK